MLRRRALVGRYTRGLEHQPGIMLRNYNQPSAHHLYVVLVDTDRILHDRDWVWEGLREAGVGVNVHYAPAYWFKPYQEAGYEGALCPNAEWVWERAITLPLYYGLSDSDVDRVVETLLGVVEGDLA